jgi:hypothetical protein
MIKFNNSDKRWLEIVFYFLCRKVFSINQKTKDIIDFINGYRWTNMFNYAILHHIVNNQKILLDTHFIPSKQEFLTVMNDPDCRLRMDTKSIRELIKDTEYTYWRKDVFHAAMKEEINKTEIYPRLKSNQVHESIYSFLLALRYVGDLVKKIKF